MGRPKASDTRDSVYREYDRLIKQERDLDPIRASFLPRGYYVRKISLCGEVRTSNESYIYQILKLRYRQ